MADPLDRVIDGARSRLLRARLERQVAASLRHALLLAVVLLAADRLWRLRFEPWYVIVAGLAVALTAGLTLGLRRRPGRIAAAAELDARLGLKERLSSAVALRGAVDADPLVAVLVDDARAHAEQIDLRRTVPWSVAFESRVCALLLAALIAVAMLPQFTFWRSESDLATEMVTRQVGDELVALAEQVEQEAESRGADRAAAEARKLMREALRLRRARMDREQALRRLERMSQEMRRAREELAGHPLERSAETARRDLRRVEGALGEVGRELEQQRLDAAAELLRQLADEVKRGEMSPEQRQELAEQAREAAEALRNSPHQAQSEALRKAAESLADGGSQSLADAADAFEQAADSLDSALDSMDEELLRDLQEYCENGKGAVGDAEGIREFAQREGDGQCPGGLCEGDGRPGSGGTNRGPGSTNEGGEDGPPAGGGTPYEEGQSPDDPGLGVYEELYAPRRAETLQHDERAGAKPGSSGRYSTTQGPRAAPGLQDSTVPYYDVLDDYQAAADEALSEGEIPLTQRQRVKRYFEELREPRSGE